MFFFCCCFLLVNCDVFGDLSKVIDGIELVDYYISSKNKNQVIFLVKKTNIYLFIKNIKNIRIEYEENTIGCNSFSKEYSKKIIKTNSFKLKENSTLKIETQWDSNDFIIGFYDSTGCDLISYSTVEPFDIFNINKLSPKLKQMKTCFYYFNKNRLQNHSTNKELFINSLINSEFKYNETIAKTNSTARSILSNSNKQNSFINQFDSFKKEKHLTRGVLYNFENYVGTIETTTDENSIIFFLAVSAACVAFIAYFILIVPFYTGCYNDCCCCKYIGWFDPHNDFYKQTLKYYKDNTNCCC